MHWRWLDKFGVNNWTINLVCSEIKIHKLDFLSLNIGFFLVIFEISWWFYCHLISTLLWNLKSDWLNRIIIIIIRWRCFYIETIIKNRISNYIHISRRLNKKYWRILNSNCSIRVIKLISQRAAWTISGTCIWDSIQNTNVFLAWTGTHWILIIIFNSLDRWHAIKDSHLEYIRCNCIWTNSHSYVQLKREYTVLGNIDSSLLVYFNWGAW